MKRKAQRAEIDGSEQLAVSIKTRAEGRGQSAEVRVPRLHNDKESIDYTRL